MQSLATRLALGRGTTLDRLAHLAARMLDAPLVAIYTGDRTRLQLRACYGPLEPLEAELRGVAAQWKLEPGVAQRLSWDIRAAAPSLSSCAGVALASCNGEPLGLLLAASRHRLEWTEEQLEALRELATLVCLDLDSERRHRGNPVMPDRRKTQEQLLEKTLELAKFGEDLRQLHRLSTACYESQDELFADYLATGRAIFGLTLGAVLRIRGRYAALAAVQDEGLSMRPGITFSWNQVFCGVVCETRGTVACANVQQDARLGNRTHLGPLRQQCYIGAPVMVDGEVYAVLSFSSPHPRRRAFSDHEIELVELMAKGIGRYVLETRMQAERDRAECLEQDRSRVLEMVAKDQPLDHVLAQVVRMVERQAPSIAVAFLLIRDGIVLCSSAPSLPETYRRRIHGTPLLFAPGCTLRAVFTRQTEIVDQQTPQCGHEHCWQACASTPVLSGNGELLGVLAAYWKVAVQPRQVDTELLEMAASLAAIAIEHRHLTDRLAHQAEHDPLTGLANRAQLARTLDQWMREGRESGRGVSVVFIDLDRFKQINDHLGHAAGDAVLSEVAARLRRCVRGREMVARLGGDEFVVVLEAGLREAEMRSREMLELLREPVPWQGHELLVTASVGISACSADVCGSEELLGQADVAMYRVKNRGKNDIGCFSPEAMAAFNHLEMEQALRRAIERGELRLQMQPIWDLRGDDVMLDGMEVLLAWDHPTMGRIPPGQFIPLAEECGLIAELGAWVLREACRRGAELLRAGHQDLRVSVNVSPLQFVRAGFVPMVLEALEESGFPPDLLELELTESAIMDNVPAAVGKLERLRSRGVQVALDDFGTGYSSLSYLRWIPVDALKIDRSFLTEIATSAGALTLVQTIVSLAHNMGLRVVAEGVEDEKQLELLRGIGCDMAQGYLLATALPEGEVELWLAAPRRLSASQA